MARYVQKWVIQVNGETEDDVIQVFEQKYKSARWTLSEIELVRNIHRKLNAYRLTLEREMK